MTLDPAIKVYDMGGSRWLLRLLEQPLDHGAEGQSRSPEAPGSVLAYDGQGFWLAQKRLSKGRFTWWPNASGPACTIESYQAQLLMAAGNPDTQGAPMWRRVS